MRQFLSILIFSTLFILPGISSAQYLCVNDKSEKKGAQNQDINKSMDAARDPLTRAFLRYRNSLAPARVCAASDYAPGIKNDIYNLGAILAQGTKVKQIKKDCIEASLQREPGNQGYSCDGDTKKKFENAGASMPCLNQKTVDFLHFAVNQAISCMSTGRVPIDPRIVLKKFNNETAFNFYLAYSGGKGIGQLTSDPVNEIAGYYKGKKFVEGNGFHILESLMDSSNPACTPFKEILREDLKSPPPSPGSPKNYCDWIRPGDGIARNLIYSMGYYVHVRDNIIKPSVERRSTKFASNSETLNYLTLAAYGPDGPAGAKALIDRLRLNNNMSAAEVKNKIIKANAYVRQTEEKFAEELLPVMKQNITDADKRGDTCVQ
ncbi:hypothetical protein [Bdellovibrio sp. BCCA]|uniref:hypothetical protein n=1 Tax=Bdellovibrio sp. BCCA TaxID=3136281 RepID=UPI0030F112A6